MEVAARVRDVLSEPFHLEGMTLRGRGQRRHRAVSRTTRGDVDPLLQLADVAMYLAKEDRTGVELYRPDRDRALDRPARPAWARLRHAIEQHELQLHYQPKRRPAGRRAGRRRGAGALASTPSAAW